MNDLSLLEIRLWMTALLLALGAIAALLLKIIANQGYDFDRVSGPMLNTVEAIYAKVPKSPEAPARCRHGKSDVCGVCINELLNDPKFRAKATRSNR